MYEQAQIILDGEILGNNVIINRHFEDIYKISPLIIKNFINIINESSSILKPVRIKKYYFTQSNCINIVFKNKIALGEVQLAYILNKNNELQMDEFKILVSENEDCFVLTQNVNEEELNCKSSEVICSKSDNIESFNNSQEDLVDGLSELNQINDEKEEDSSYMVEENLSTSIKESFNHELELNNNFEEKGDTEYFFNENEKEAFTENLDSEEDMFEAKKEIYKRNSDRKKDEIINIKDKNVQEENLLKTSENTDRQERIIEKTIIEKIYTQNIEAAERIAEDSTKEIVLEQTTENFDSVGQNAKNVVVNEFSEQDVVNTEAVEQLIENPILGETSEQNSEKIAEDLIVENSDINEKTFFDESKNVDTFYEQESVELENSKETELEDIINIDKAEKTNETSEVVGNNNFNEVFEIFEENNYDQYMDSNIKDFDFIDKYINDDDLVDFYDVIPRFIDDDFQADKAEDSMSVESCKDDKEEEKLQNSDKKVFEDKKVENLNELNRDEKIAMYQKILKGYDNGMTENKLNKLRENFNIIQNKEDEMTSDDVLNAQVKLLLDNSSKAFRILETEGKQDVIQIDEELFLSKDKIYTWGDVYYLE